MPTSPNVRRRRAERLDGLIVPGFVDAHVHYPQIECIASHGEQLMQWLERHIFPAEKAFADRGHADAIAAFFLDELLRHGTTSALVFATVHAGSVDALFEAALARDMRIVSGKVLMDLGPEGLRDTRRLRPRRHRGPDRPMARPRPPRLCRHAALRAHLQRRAARRCRRAGRRASRRADAHPPLRESGRDRLRRRALPRGQRTISTSTTGSAWSGRARSSPIAST